MERYTVALYHENVIDGINTPIERPIAFHVSLHPLFKKRVNYSNEYIARELAEKLRQILEAEEEIY